MKNNKQPQESKQKDSKERQMVSIGRWHQAQSAPMSLHISTPSQATKGAYLFPGLVIPHIKVSICHQPPHSMMDIAHAMANKKPPFTRNDACALSPLTTCTGIAAHCTGDGCSKIWNVLKKCTLFSFLFFYLFLYFERMDI